MSVRQLDGMAVALFGVLAYNVVGGHWEQSVWRIELLFLPCTQASNYGFEGYLDTCFDVIRV